jgi:hypothetical protein
MKRIALTFSLLLGTFLMNAQTAPSGPSPVTLRSLRDQHRALLIFTPDTNAQFLHQIRELAANANDLRERDLVVIPILSHEDNKPWGVTFRLDTIATLSASEQAAARKRFHIAPDAFTVILIGKDGGEKLRSSSPVSLDKLLSTIDAMPMRQDEMRQRKP